LRFLADLNAYQTDHNSLWHTITQSVPSMRASHLLSADAWSLLETAAKEAEVYEAHAQETFALLQMSPEAGDVLDALVPSNPASSLSGALSTSLDTFSQAWEELLTLTAATAETLDAWAS